MTHPDPVPHPDHWLTNGIRQIGKTEYVLFAVAVLCMSLTIITTWPLWQNRTSPPNLPILPALTGVPFGALILLSLAVALWQPRKGFIGHLIVLGVAIAFDQIRCQPQIFSLPVLMAACLWREFRPVARWFLIAMWLWAGVHKLLSPDWMGPISWTLLDMLGMENSLEWYRPFAWSVGIGEIVLGVIAIFKPRWAAFVCGGMHFGIVIMLVNMNWNFSVLYWNVANAIIGFWLLWSWRTESVSDENVARRWPRELWQQVVVVILLISPVGVYNGMVPHFLAHVLYSDNMPKPMMTTAAGPEEINVWESLYVPIPRLPAILRQYFESVADIGDKLHIYDPRPGMLHLHYGMAQFEAGESVLHRAEPISQAAFWDATTGVGQGFAQDYPPAVFYLEKAGIKMLKRTQNGKIYAIQFSPDKYNARLFQHVSGLLNLEQIQLADCELRDEDLEHVTYLPVLYGIGLDNTPVTNAALIHLDKVDKLRHLERNGTEITDAAVREWLDR